ncbi:beta-phosphoglucomutase (beta-pgm) [Spiroplasma clarkii]|uniref:Beta-phosphoglucomutase n=1 Tax=Spiroplasma clarkii TaxID=2139 RepID=A0A1Y0L2F8_9MOLU|nr:beta-phosphoglucomutase [Spiroplasma clarkii]ARU92173.1 beta-phosphoglucomutase (beta-pgm) [Spiroplasma clarkii]ATX71504.1 beta-phosphoglucomutase [Spiroplasma clarkii]
MRYPKLVIFDCDGIITETAHLHYQAWKAIAKSELGVTLDETYLDAFRGLSRVDSLKIILNLMPSKTIPAIEVQEEIIKKKNNYYVELITHKENVLLLPGVVDFILELRALGIKIAMASTSRNSKKLMQLHDILNLFDFIVDPGSVAHQKPAPDIFLAAINHFGLQPKDCWGVEDAKVGVTSIIESGAFAIGVGDPQLVGEANLVLADTSLLTLDKILPAYNK